MFSHVLLSLLTEKWVWIMKTAPYLSAKTHLETILHTISPDILCRAVSDSPINRNKREKILIFCTAIRFVTCIYPFHVFYSGRGEEHNPNFFKDGGGHVPKRPPLALCLLGSPQAESVMTYFTFSRAWI